MANNVTDLGKVGMTPKGTWSSSTTYERLDVVTYEGSSYVSLVDSNTNNNPGTSSTKWQLMAAHGEFTEAQLEEFKAAVVAASEEEMDEYTDTKKGVLDDYTDTKKTELNTYTGTKKTELDTYTGGLKTDFNDNATSKTTAFNTNATNKTTDFNDNASSKTTAFNTNASDKTTAFNTNASDKTTAFDNNASAKQTAFDSHVEDKIDEFDDNAADIQQEIDELAANMPWETPTQATEFNITDAAKYSRNSIQLFGNTSQKTYTGYNLVDVSPYQEETKNGVTLTKDSEGNIILNGTATANTSWNLTFGSTKTLVAGTYTKSVTKDTNIRSGITVGLGYNGSSISGTTIQPLAGIGTMTLESDTIYDQIRIYIGNGTTFNNYKLSYMILLGEYTIDTIPDWEPFVGGIASPNPNFPQQIHVVTGNNTIGVQGANIFDGEIEGGTIDYSTGANATATTGIVRSKNYIPISSSFTIITKTPFNSAHTIGWRYYDKDYNYIGRGSTYLTNYAAVTPSNSLDTSKAVAYARFIDSSANSDTTEEFCIRIDNGNTYEPYTHQDYPINLGSLELCKIGDYQDYLYKENGNWYKYGIIAQKVLDGQETWNMPNSSSFPNMFQHSEQLNLSSDYDTSGADLGYSNFFKVRTNTNLTTQNGVILLKVGGNEYIRIIDLDQTTVGNFKTWLSTHNVSIYYALATPVITQITDETLIAQLDAIYEHLQLVKGTNTISVTASDLAPYMELSYMQDLKSKLDNLESRLSLLE